jgi:vancomycin resistance protein YoaR
MNTSSINYRNPTQPSTPTMLHKALALLLGGLVLTGIFSLAILFVLQVAYAGKILPGVSVLGVDIGGLTKAEAAWVLQNQLPYPQQGLIALEDSSTVWTFTPQDLGLFIDYGGTIDAAYKIGRQGWPWQRFSQRFNLWRSGEISSPKLVLDERILRQQLNTIASQINRPMVEANLKLEGTQVIAEPGQVGRMLDMEATIVALHAPMTNLLDASQILVVKEFTPNILDASTQADAAAAILSRPLILRVSDDSDEQLGPWEFSPETLANMLVIERVAENGVETYQVQLDGNKLYNFLQPLMFSLKRNPQNARFIFNDETRELETIQPSVIGRDLLVEETIEHINIQLQHGVHLISLVFDYTNPEVPDTALATELGITELVSAESSFFYGSSDGRIQNIQTAASQFHGLLVPPGATFSMVENIGEISLDSGYAEAWIIYGDRTVKGVGGGVCQVSTTLFRTVFFGGYPIEERWPHAYRVYYYELMQSGAVNEDLAGLDATVYAPIVDFRFTNDTPYWLLMETYVDAAARKITWKFYSTSDGRQVEWSTTGLTATEKPPFPVYEENEDLKEGQIKQVDWAVDGATVVVTRTVTRNGNILHSDTFKTVYEPWAAVCQYGPGTEDYPPKENKQDRYSCKVKKK